MSRNKIQVFISSACGDEPEKQKYNFVREALKVLIESTGFAEVYTFESEGASTTSAGQHYSSALEGSDVCIFLIDNLDGVSSGVQKEIDTVKKHNIKSMFYFCDQFSKEETPLQKSLRGEKYVKSVTVHDFKELIKKGANDFMNELLSIYKHYCKGRLTQIEEHVTEQSYDISNIELPLHTSNVMEKDLTANIDSCIKYFTRLILGYAHDEVKQTGKVDEVCVAFLPVVFEGATINEEKFISLLIEIEKQQPKQYFEVIKKRYEAIKEYYLGRQKSCIDKLNEALQLAKNNNLEEWFIKDILIDLRNQSAIFDESQNTYLHEQIYQQELNSSNSLFCFPLMDRFCSNYYEGIINEAIKNKLQSPDTVVFGNYLGKHVRALSEVFILAMYNGSITHIQLLYERVKHMAFYFATIYSDWNIKKILLETAIINGREKDIDGVLSYFDDLRSKMNAKDAHDIYAFADNLPIAHQKFVAKLEAFRVTCYYMDDETFNSAWTELNISILQWVENSKSAIVIGSHIFSALEGAYLRIAQNQLIQIIFQCIQNNKRRFYNEIFRLIGNCINLDEASDESVSNFLNIIIKIVKSPEERLNIHSLERALFMLRKKFRSLTDELDKIIEVEMPDFYKGLYRLETNDNENANMGDFLKSYIAQVRNENETQGENGTFFGYGNRPHITIKNILFQSQISFSNELINSAFIVSSETLLKENQTIEAKLDAIELLVYLIKSQPTVQEDNKMQIEKLLLNKTQVETAKALMTNLSKTSLRISSLLLYDCLGEKISTELLDVLSDIGDDVLSNRKASKAFLNYLEASATPIFDTLLEHIILQQAIKWCTESDLSIRSNSVQILFLLLRNLDNQKIICNQLVKRMDTDNVYIKNKILLNVHQLADANPETLKYIIEKASVDTNYVVRKVVDGLHIKLK